MNNVSGLIRIVSIVLSAIVAISFSLFVWDELGAASKNQANLATPAAIQTQLVRDAHGRLLSEENGKIRIKLDQANDALTSPGESIGKQTGGNAWSMRFLSFLFGIIVFLVGLRMLANWIELRERPVASQQQQNYTAGYR